MPVSSDSSLPRRILWVVVEKSFPAKQSAGPEAPDPFPSGKAIRQNAKPRGQNFSLGASLAYYISGLCSLLDFHHIIYLLLNIPAVIKSTVLQTATQGFSN